MPASFTAAASGLQQLCNLQPLQQRPNSDSVAPCIYCRAEKTICLAGGQWQQERQLQTLHHSLP